MVYYEISDYWFAKVQLFSISPTKIFNKKVFDGKML